MLRGFGRRRACVFLALCAAISLLLSLVSSSGSSPALVRGVATSHHQRASPSLDAGDRRRVLDDDPIHIVQSFCIFEQVKAEDAGLTALRSLLAARAAGASRNRRYVIHILADDWAAWLLSNNHSAKPPAYNPQRYLVKVKAPHSLTHFQELWGDVLAYVGASAGRVELHVHPEDDAFAAVEAALGAGATLGFNHDGFKRCSPLRLLLPFIPEFSNVSRALFFDMDVVVLCDVEEMLGLFDEWTGDQWIGLAPEDKEDPPPGASPPHGALPCAPQFGWSGVNNGVMMWRIDRIREHLAEYWEEVMRIINEKMYRAPRFAAYHAKIPSNLLNHPEGALYYDQDIMGIASFDWPARFFKLPRRFNWRFKLGRDFPASAWGDEAGICVEHYSNGDFNVEPGQGRTTLFQYWRDYRRIAPGAAPRPVRGAGAPVVPWEWEWGTGRSVGPQK